MTTASNLIAALSASVTVVVALLIDRLCGEPPAWAHPVVAMGRYLGALGPKLCTWPSPAAWWGGALAWLVGAATALTLALLAERGLHRLPWAFAATATGVLLKPLLAWRMLRDEVAAVESALAESLDTGRARLQCLVSREVAGLDAPQVRESAIESLAENLNDSLVAPLFWFVLGGLPGAALYRWANTADAMWGYRGRYEWAGKWAARADDVMSWLPARLTAGLLCLGAGRRLPWRSLQTEARRTPSPNSGWPMAAMALLLGVHLRKPAVYTLNAAGAAAEARHTRQALTWAGRAVGWTACGCVLARIFAAVALGSVR